MSIGSRKLSYSDITHGCNMWTVISYHIKHIRQMAPLFSTTAQRRSTTELVYRVVCYKEDDEWTRIIEWHSIEHILPQRPNRFKLCPCLTCPAERFAVWLCLHLNQGRIQELSKGGWRAREREPITGVWGRSPQRGPGAEPLVRGSAGEAPWSWKSSSFWLQRRTNI